MVSSFTGHLALIIHDADHHREALEAQIKRIGLAARVVPVSDRVSVDHVDADVIFFDADTGHDRLFHWAPAFPPVPLIALLGSEAPGRIEWALSQHATAFLAKPIGSSRVFQTLLAAHQLHAEMKRLRDTANDLAERVRARPLVVRATLEMMRQHGLDELQALDRLRRAAMSARISIESLAAMIASQPVLACRLGETPEPMVISSQKGRRATT